MGITPEEFLESGRILLQKKEEVDHRNATSRAYYGAFHACRNLARRLGLDIRGSGGMGSHRALVNALFGFTVANNSAIEPKQINQIRNAGKQLSPLISKRHEADYDLDREHLLNEARHVVSSSSKIMAQVEKILTTLPCPTK
ncbi:MAG: hypothetical protein HQL52_07045 [Magnetococcales bacterium]|nr:hypothetical protein [Magnetococcales bacterium]